jgi:uncharacterized protein (DUF2236 family)
MTVTRASQLPEAYFEDSSLVRVVHREQIVALYGARALLMQAAHPVAFAGFFAHTGALDEPYERLARTARVMDTIIFGTRRDADRATRRVRAMHHRVSGSLAQRSGNFAAGTPYAADDPVLLLWILACLADSGIVIYERYVRKLSGEERERYWQDFRLIGKLFGLPLKHSPRTFAAFELYMREMMASGDLHISAQARELGKRIVLHPPVPLLAWPLLELANFHVVGSLPRGLRRQYRLGWDPARELALLAGAQYARRVLLPLAPGRLRYVASARVA